MAITKSDRGRETEIAKQRAWNAAVLGVAAANFAWACVFILIGLCKGAF